MNILLLIRSDILTILILAFLLLYDFHCRKFITDKKNYFVPFALSCLGHSIFGLITEITVNSTDVSSDLNDICHVIFFFMALMYCLTFFRYILSLIFPVQKARKIFIPVLVVSFVAILIMCLSKIEYLQGNGTKYSSGLGPTICYTTGFVMFLVSNLLVLFYKKRLSHSLVFSILPISTLTVTLLVIQILVPEFLFTGSALSLSALGVFFAIENPIKNFERRAFVDSLTGLYNRNKYEQDLQKLESSRDIISVVLCDMNGLKCINDFYGHLAGDNYIRSIANILNTEFKSAWNIYRIGGDEFVVLLKNISPHQIAKEMSDVTWACQNTSKILKSELSISMGDATKGESESFETMLNRADQRMYESKRAYYAQAGKDRRFQPKETQ